MYMYVFYIFEIFSNIFRYTVYKIIKKSLNDE